MKFKLPAVAAMVLALTLAAPAFSQSRLKDASANRELSDQIMALVVKGDIEGGLRLAKPYLVIPESEVDTLIGQTKMQLPALEMRFGKPVGVEYIGQDKVGEHVMRIVQICRYEKHLMRWNFYFYRTPTGWVLNAFHFDDKLQALF